MPVYNCLFVVVLDDSIAFSKMPRTILDLRGGNILEFLDLATSATEETSIEAEREWYPI